VSSYGRNFGFRIPPVHGNRLGRFVTPATGAEIPIGAPVTGDATVATNALGFQTVDLTTGTTARPLGNAGIIVYEYGPNAFAGDDQNLVQFSDKATVPLGAACQVVHGPGVKVVFTNTLTNAASVDFTGTYRSSVRVMVAGMGATPTVAIGDYLTPGTGNDSAGYWAETGTFANAWLVVTSIDTSRLEVEAEFLF